MKLSKAQRKAHNQAEELLKKDELTFDEKYFVLENWLPGANHDIGSAGVFFTPREMAYNFCIEVSKGNIIDLCAGIGMLSFQLHRFHQGNTKLTCIERNEEFVRVGKKVLPEATWICGDVLSEELVKSLGQFDCAISNPPFGNIKSHNPTKWLKYKGREFEYKVIEIGSYLARYGVFILPQTSCPFRISGNRHNSIYNDGNKTTKYKAFEVQTGLYLSPNMGIDLSVFKNDWVGANVLCEIALCEYELIAEEKADTNKRTTPVQGYLFND